MTAQLDLHDSTTAAGIASEQSEPTGGPRRRRWLLPAGLVAASVVTIVGLAVESRTSSVERIPQKPTVVRIDATSVAPRPPVESAIIRAERSWAGDEFDLPPVEDVCLTHDPC
jgi:hypothetical protein